ncbi:helix-turn-helix transcriptional regulator [Gammaproteobacteria bacterium]|nr:helix-turn-helix transcriptional regulator [Gammaproteobacteria bacterium]
MSELNDTFRKNLKKIMAARGLSANRLSQISSVSQVMISYILKSSRGASLDSVQAIADALGLPAYMMLVPEFNFEHDPDEIATNTRLFQSLDVEQLAIVREFVAFQTRASGSDPDAQKL